MRTDNTVGISINTKDKSAIVPISLPTFKEVSFGVPDMDRIISITARKPITTVVIPKMDPKILLKANMLNTQHTKVIDTRIFQVRFLFFIELNRIIIPMMSTKNPSRVVAEATHTIFTVRRIRRPRDGILVPYTTLLLPCQ